MPATSTKPHRITVKDLKGLLSQCNSSENSEVWIMTAAGDVSMPLAMVSMHSNSDHVFLVMMDQEEFELED